MILFTWLILASPAVVDQIYNVYLSAFVPQNRFKEGELEEYFENKVMPRFEKELILLSATDNDQMVGYIILEKMETTYYIAELAIRPTYQGQGLGKKVIFSILEKDPSTQKILLLTEIENRWSRGFYEKIGFIPSAYTHPDYPTDFTAYEYNLTPN
jgi:ribosomal protein S18 acetylase RimI-like enzyme